MQTWRRAGIPTSGYLFMRGARAHVDPVLQAEALARSLRMAGITTAIVDWERDKSSITGIDHGFPTVGELQACVDHLDHLGFPVMGYWSEGTSPGRPIRRLAARWIANYSRRPRVKADAWQFTSKPWDRSVWLGDESTFRVMFPGSGPVVVPVPLPPTPGAREKYPMLNLVPQTLRRVVELPVGVVFREFPSIDANRVAVVVDTDEGSDTKAFGYIGKAIGLGGWLQVANGDRGQWVRESDVADIRPGEKNVGA